MWKMVIDITSEEGVVFFASNGDDIQLPAIFKKNKHFCNHCKGPHKWWKWEDYNYACCALDEFINTVLPKHYILALNGIHVDTIEDFDLLKIF